MIKNLFFDLDNTIIKDELEDSNYYKEELNAPVIETPEMAEPEKEIVATDFANENAKKEPIDSVKLFVTKTCPNCKKAEELLDMAGIQYSIIDANENPDECEKFQIMQAPTLIVNDSTKYVNLSNVIKFVEETTITV